MNGNSSKSDEGSPSRKRFFIDKINYVHHIKIAIFHRKSSEITKVNDEKYFKYIDCDEESILNSDILTSSLVDEPSPIVLEQEVVTDME